MATELGSTLLALARNAIAEKLGEPLLPFETGSWLQEPAATFVTIKRFGELRGCIGSLSPHRSLREDVETNARAAAFQDSRFAPLSRAEFPQIELEVSLLSPLEKMEFDSQEHLLAQLRPQVDGVVLEFGWWKGTFLPQVWEELPDPRDFLHHLLLKAGLPDHFWSDQIQCSRFTVSKWREKEVVGARGRRR